MKFIILTECVWWLGGSSCMPLPLIVAWLSNVRWRSLTTPRPFISSATGRSTPVTDTDNMVGTAAWSWPGVFIRTRDLSGLSCRPFCMYHCVTAVQAVRTAKPDFAGCCDLTRKDVICGITEFYSISAWSQLHYIIYTCSIVMATGYLSSINRCCVDRSTFYAYCGVKLSLY